LPEMGKCRSYCPRKRKFHGNQNACIEIASCKEEIMTTSSLKLQHCNQLYGHIPQISNKPSSKICDDLKPGNYSRGIFYRFHCETKNKTAEGKSDRIESKLKADGLDIMNCRAQVYDNAAAMAGCPTGVQQRIKDIIPNEELFSLLKPFAKPSLCTFSFIGGKFGDFLWYARTLLLFYSYVDVRIGSS
ncbi:hypothetical protein TNCT_134771, partial [Trichonephila clavata]